MNRMTLLLMGVLLLAGFSTAAQNVQYQEGPQIDEMMKKYVALNQEKTNLSGWRIQILATTDRQKLDNVKQTFQYRYPNVPLDWVHTPPYYKLRAGAFATKLEATRLKHILGRDYTGIYLVKDDKIPMRLIVGY